MHRYERVEQQPESSTSNSYTNGRGQGDNTNSSLQIKKVDKGKKSVKFEEPEGSSGESKFSKRDVIRRGFNDTTRSEGQSPKNGTYKDHIDLLARLDTKTAAWPLPEETLNGLPPSDKRRLAPTPGNEKTPGSGLLRTMGKKQVGEPLASTQATDSTRTPQQDYMKEVRSRRNSRIARELGIEEPARMQGPSALDFHETAEQLRPTEPSAQKVREPNYPQERQVPETAKGSFVNSIVRRAQEVTFGTFSGDQAKYTRISSRESDIPLGNLPSRQNPYESVQSRTEERPITYPTLTRVSRQPDTHEQPSSSNADATGGMGQDNWWEIPI